MFRLSRRVDFFYVFTFNMHTYSMAGSMADHHAPLNLPEFDSTLANAASVVRDLI